MKDAPEPTPVRELRHVRLRSADGTELAADELDGRSPALLFLHGLASTRAGEKSTSLLGFARRQQQRLLRLDFRGHGESAGKLEDLTLTGLVADARAGLDHVERAIVVGSSLGGLVGSWLAATQPQQVVALVLIAPAFGFLRRMAARPRVAGRVLIDSPWARAEISERVLDDARAWPEANLAERVTVPTLIVHGTRDDVVPLADSERVFAAIPHPRKDLWIVPDGDHRLLVQVELIWPRLQRLLDHPAPGA